MRTRLLSARRIGPPLVGLATAAVAVLVLEALIRHGVVNRFIVPPPSEILGSFAMLIEDEDLLHRFAVTSLETLAAAALATLLGIPLGWLLYRYRLLRAAFESWVAATAAAPLILLYPLFLVIFGRNAATIVFMGFLAALTPIVLKTREGLGGTRRVLLNVGRSFGLTPAQQFRKILFPAAVPTIFTGLRLGLIFALINIVGVEFLINFGGLGQLIADLSDRYEIPAMYGAIFFVILVSVCFFFVTEKLERWLRPG
jgi:NitT/TauT family transport system permease protein